MARAQWPLHSEMPIIEVVLTMAQGGQKTSRILLADTGAGTAVARFELILDETDCLLCGGASAQTLKLGGAYAGSFPRYFLRVQIPQLNFDDFLFAIGVPRTPDGVDGIAGFRFLNRFTYGNLGSPREFGLEM
jgi:hypothetical protein